MLVAEVLGQLRFQRRLEDVLGELVQQPSRANQADALFFRLHEQPLREVLLINDLSCHGIDHRMQLNLGRVRHGHLLSDQAEPSHTVIETVPEGCLVVVTADPTRAGGCSSGRRERATVQLACGPFGLVRIVGRGSKPKELFQCLLSAVAELGRQRCADPPKVPWLVSEPRDRRFVGRVAKDPSVSVGVGSKPHPRGRPSKTIVLEPATALCVEDVDSHPRLMFAVTGSCARCVRVRSSAIGLCVGGVDIGLVFVGAVSALGDESRSGFGFRDCGEPDECCCSSPAKGLTIWVGNIRGRVVRSLGS